jgi:hypothetical protein
MLVITFDQLEDRQQLLINIGIELGFIYQMIGIICML